MIRCAAVALSLVALLRSGAPQELKAEVLDKLKSATVFVKAENRGRRGTGTGFLFLKRGTTGYIMTCEHVVGAASTVLVVFWSGTPQEKAYPARVVATDPTRDLACLTVKDMPNLPAALELGRKTEVKETESVFAAGFPFGELLGARDKNPEITVSKSSVSSIRRNSAGEMVAVQIGGEVHPGNSGGPLITADGRVVGVNQSKLMGTGTAFAVPSEEIQGFLQGRVKGSKFRKVGGTAKTGKYEITLDLADPLSTLKGAGIAYIDERQVKEERKPEKDGSWKKIHDSMKTVAFKMEAGRAVETLEFTLEGAAANLSVVFQCYFVRADGTTVWTEPAIQDIDFGPGADPAAGGANGGRRPPGAADRPDDPEPPPAPEPSAGPTVEIALPDAMSVAAELPVSSVFGGLLMAPDGSALYALDLTEGQLYKLDPDNLQIKAKLDVSENAVALAMTPDGKTLYVGCRSVFFREDRRDDRPAGAIQIINAAAFTLKSTLDTKGGIVELVATDRGLVAATCLAQWDGLAIIDVEKKTEESVHMIRGGSAVRLTRDQRRVYVGDRDLSPGDFRCVELRRVNGQYASYDSTYHGEHNLGGSFEFSPDSRYLISAQGPILRLARTRDADMKYVTKIDPFLTAAVAAGCTTLVTVTSDGFAKTYNLPGFELQKSVRLGQRCEKAILDLKRRRIHGLFSAPDARPFDRELRLGRVTSISLGSK